MKVLKWGKVKVITREEKEWGWMERREGRRGGRQQQRLHNHENRKTVAFKLHRWWFKPEILLSRLPFGNPNNLLICQNQSNYFRKINKHTHKHTHTQTTPTQFSASLSSLWICSLYFKRYASYIYKEKRKVDFYTCITIELHTSSKHGQFCPVSAYSGLIQWK